MSKIIDVLSKVDFDLLYQQKLALLDTIVEAGEYAGSNTLPEDIRESWREKADHLEGILNFLDEFLDAAAAEGEFTYPDEEGAD